MPVLPVLIVRRDFREICRNEDTVSILYSVVDAVQTREGMFRFWFAVARVPKGLWSLAGDLEQGKIYLPC